MKKLLLMILAFVFALSVSALEPKSVVSAYCVGIVFDIKDSEPFCGFIIASFDEAGKKIEINTVSCPGSFSEALSAMESSDIRLSLPTVKGIYISDKLPMSYLETSLVGMLATEGFPPDATVVYCDEPIELSEEQDGGTSITGAMYIPKLMKNKGRDVSLVEFTQDKNRKAPYLSFSDGRFVIEEDF